MKKELQKIVEDYVKLKGLEVSKLLQAAHHGGLFTGDRAAVYDVRTVYSIAELRRLVKEGFNLSGAQDMGVYLLNAIFYS